MQVRYFYAQFLASCDTCQLEFAKPRLELLARDFLEDRLPLHLVAFTHARSGRRRLWTKLRQRQHESIRSQHESIRCIY